MIEDKIKKGLTNVYANRTQTRQIFTQEIQYSLLVLQCTTSTQTLYPYSVYSTNRTTQERPPPERPSICTPPPAVRRATRAAVATVPAATATTAQEQPVRRRVRHPLSPRRIRRIITLLLHHRRITIHLCKRDRHNRLRRSIIYITHLGPVRITLRRHMHQLDSPSNNSYCCMLRMLRRASKPQRPMVRLLRRR